MRIAFIEIRAFGYINRYINFFLHAFIELLLIRMRARVREFSRIRCIDYYAGGYIDSYTLGYTSGYTLVTGFSYTVLHKTSYTHGYTGYNNHIN